MKWTDYLIISSFAAYLFVGSYTLYTLDEAHKAREAALLYSVYKALFWADRELQHEQRVADVAREIKKYPGMPTISVNTPVTNADVRVVSDSPQERPPGLHASGIIWLSFEEGGYHYMTGVRKDDVPALDGPGRPKWSHDIAEAFKVKVQSGDDTICFMTATNVLIRAGYMGIVRFETKPVIQKVGDQWVIHAANTKEQK